MPTDTDFAWAAGFIDGEGCLDFGRNLARRMPFIPRVTVGNTDEPALAALVDLFQGSISVRRRPDPRHQPMFAWQVTGATGCRRVLEPILPFLVVKRTQAEVMLRFCELVRPAGVSGGNGRSLSPENLAAREAVVAEFKALRGGRRGPKA